MPLAVRFLLVATVDWCETQVTPIFHLSSVIGKPRECWPPPHTGQCDLAENPSKQEGPQKLPITVLWSEFNIRITLTFDLNEVDGSVKFAH